MNWSTAHIVSVHDQKATFAFENRILKKRGMWAIWTIALLFLTGIFSLTITTTPFLHMDEILVVELGRTILNTNTDWSVAWLLTQNKPVVTIFYLGPVLQELSYQLLGEYGPRISALVGGLLAGTIMLGWVVSKGIKVTPAFLLALVFLLDPLFVQAFTMGRVDGWAMSFCLASCWVLRSINPRYTFKLHVILAGALAVVAMFIWPSSLFLYPLLFLELLDVTREIKLDGKSSTFPVIFHFCIGGIITVIIVMLPVITELYGNLETILKGLQVNTQPGSGYEQSENSFISLLRVLKFSPLLVIFALISLAIRRDIKLTIAMGAASTLMLLTVVYMHRVLYLVPYFIVAISALYYSSNAASRSSFHFPKIVGRLSIVALLVWAFALSVFARTALAFSQNSESGRSLLYKTANTVAGKGNHAVFSPFELYYAGNELGWQMYRPYKAVGEKLSAEMLEKLLPQVDYVILIKQELTAEVVQLLKVQGFRDTGWYHAYEDPVKKMEYGKTEADKKYWGNLWRLRSVFSIYRQPYGPYRTYVRQPINQNL